MVDYQLKGVPDAEPLYRLVTNIMTPSEAPAEELAALYAGRWGIETVFDELKTHLRGARIVLRSKTPELVRQEFYGLLLAHLSIRSLMHQAALGSDIAPRDVSFIHAVHVVRRKLPRWAALPPPRGRKKLPRAILEEILQERVKPNLHRWNPRGLKRKMRLAMPFGTLPETPRSCTSRLFTSKSTE